MPLRFEAAHGSAIDPHNGLKIFQPRMEPTATPDEVEYQYPIYRGDALYGFGCSGLMTVLQEQGRPVRVFTLDLGQDRTIKWIQELQQQLDIDGDAVDFTLRLAEGLVQVFQSDTGNNEEVRYLALTQGTFFEDQRWAVPAGLARLANGDVVLAQVVVPMRPAGVAP